MGTKRVMTSIEIDQKTPWKKPQKKRTVASLCGLRVAAVYQHRGPSLSHKSQATLIQETIPTPEFKAKRLIPPNLCLD